MLIYLEQPFSALLISRVFKRGENGDVTTRFEVTTADGEARIKRPQQTPDKFYSVLGFDPLEFLRMSPADKLSTKIAEIDAEKAKRVAEAKMPIEGLGFTDSGVTFKGIPFEQISSAEQLRVSVAIGIALNPDLRVLLIRDGSLLDSDNLALIAEMAAEHDVQVWIERVEEDGAGFIIEDGEVKA